MQTDMPSIHVPEAVFREYVYRAGGYDEAKDEIKQTLRDEAGVSE
jgi:hypothetical protein